MAPFVSGDPRQVLRIYATMPGFGVGTHDMRPVDFVFKLISGKDSDSGSRRRFRLRRKIPNWTFLTSRSSYSYGDGYARLVRCNWRPDNDDRSMRFR